MEFCFLSRFEHWHSVASIAEPDSNVAFPLAPRFSAEFPQVFKIEQTPFFLRTYGGRERVDHLAVHPVIYDGFGDGFGGSRVGLGVKSGAE
jgi:hypothetical protein